MAFTVTTDLQDFVDAESATPFSTGSLDPDYYVQGSNSVGFYMAKNARGSVTINPTDVNWTAGDHVYAWLSSSVAAKMENKSTGTTTASGVTLRVTLANGAYREWHVTGADTWGGEWKCFVIDLAHTGSQLYASSGTWVDTSDIASMTIYWDLSNSGNIRNVPANCWVDAIRVGTGVTAYNTSAADAAFDFADIAAYCEAVAQAYGITETIDGIVFCQARITVGDTGSNHVDFNSQDEVFVFRNRNGDGEGGFVADSLYRIDFVGNATGADQAISLGVKVGTGDAMSGRNGTLILGGGSAVRYQINADDADLHSFTMYGCTIRGAYLSTTTVGVQFGTPTTTHEIAGTTFDGCSEIDTRDAIVRNCNFLNTVAATTNGALLWDEGEIDIANCLFVNNAVGIEVVSLTGDMSFDGMEFSGDTYDVRYEGTTDWDLNWTNASGAPSIQNASTGTLTAVNTVTHTLTGLQLNTKVTYVRNSDGVELYTEVATTSDGLGKYKTVYSYGGAVVGITVDLLIMHLDYYAYEPQIVMPGTNTTLPVVQQPDLVYSNP
jgi:hypothetical protein